jgi:hypothetical protein
MSSLGSLGHRSDEVQYRNFIKNKNLNWISQQQHLAFKLAENQFAHLTVDEFRQLYLNLNIPNTVPAFEFNFK